MEEQNLYILYILNWQSCINICGNINNNDNNKTPLFWFLKIAEKWC